MEHLNHKAVSPEVPARVSVLDVARMAKVSAATVSRVINRPEQVRPALRERVQRSIEVLRYTPDSAARALRSRRTRTVGAVIPTLDVGVFAEGLQAMQIRLAEYGYTLLMASSQYDPERERQEIGTLVQRGVDGLLLVGASLGADTYRSIRSHGIPFLTTYICESCAEVPAVGIDNEEAAREVAQHLISLGHREIGVITNMHNANDRAIARLRGIQKALAAADISLPSRMVYNASHSLLEGREGLRALVGGNPLLTAVICTTDTHAMGVLAEARSMGWTVPGRLSVTGFHDTELSANLDPPLTTVNVAADIIGRVAVEHLMRLVQGEAIDQSTRVPHRLVVRDSSGPAPHT